MSRIGGGRALISKKKAVPKDKSMMMKELLSGKKHSPVLKPKKKVVRQPKKRAVLKKK